MHRFYVNESRINNDNISINGSDVNHIKNVLRLKVKDPIIICDGRGNDYQCLIKEISQDQVLADIIDINKNGNELSSKVYLFQGVAKGSKMELIIQKAVELGVYEVVPVTTKRTIVKFNNSKKEKKKLERWQSIATSAAKQSGRGIIPEIKEVMTFKDSLEYSKELECKLIPYEKAKDIKKTRDIIHQLGNKKSIGIFIGPEGGFEEDEIGLTKEYDFEVITLGRRILRTETAGLAVLSMTMLELDD